MGTKKLRSIDLFAGIGGMRIGLEAAGFETAYANDIDVRAAETYRLNFGEIDNSDLFDVVRGEDMSKIPKHFDLLSGGFPCQPFSVAGHKMGFADERRGQLLFAVIDILKARQPRAVLLENVKYLKHHDDEKTYARIKSELEGAGYYIDAKVLNSMHYGNVPQTRERIYIVGFRSPRTLMKFNFPDKVSLTKSVPQLLEKNVADRYYYTPEDKIIYPRLKETVKSRDKVYQYRRVYVRENRNDVCPTLTASMGAGGHNVPIIKDWRGIRKLTPRECSRMQGFPESFTFPPQFADAHLYKQIGNSVTVPVVARIAEKIRVALES